MVKCLSSCKDVMCSGVILFIGIMICSYEITLRFSIEAYVCIRTTHHNTCNIYIGKMLQRVRYGNRNYAFHLD